MKTFVLSWLPAPGRKTLILCSAEQAALTALLANGEVSFAAKAQAVLEKEGWL